MIIHSHKKHISLQILHWMRNDVVVQCSFTRVCQGVPNKMLGASYTNRDVSSFQTRDLYCNGRNKYVQLSHLLFVLEMCRWYVVLDKFVSYSRRQSTSFFHNFKLELYSFCEHYPYDIHCNSNSTQLKHGWWIIILYRGDVKKLAYFVAVSSGYGGRSSWSVSVHQRTLPSSHATCHRMLDINAQPLPPPPPSVCVCVCVLAAVDVWLSS